MSTEIQELPGAVHRSAGKYRDFAHVGPDTLAGRYMRTFWHPIFRSQDLLPGEARPIRILGEDLTLFRGESGAPHLVGFRCRHRGTQLSVGWVERDDIRCFYHGWKYDARGQCIEQPAEADPSCQKVRVSIPSHPVQDYLGLVFAFIAEGAPPPLPRYPGFETEAAYLTVDLNHRGYNFFQDFENGMDRVHGGFVHRSLPGSFDGRIDGPMVTAEEDDWGLTTTARHPSGRLGVQTFGMPNKQHIKFTFGDRGLEDAELLTWKVPVDDENTAHFTVTRVLGEDAIGRYKAAQQEGEQKTPLDAFELAREVVAGRMRHDDVDPRTTEMVWFQDNIALLAQGRIADRDNEHLGASDSPVVLLRRLWERELRALDEGRPLKQWRYSPSQRIRKK